MRHTYILYSIISLLLPLAGVSAWAQDEAVPADTAAAPSPAADTIKGVRLGGATVKASTGTRRLGGAAMGQYMGQGELFKAACCNLGESFVNNPSVDVNYTDATTGARQIRLLGLSGIYVQMLTENMPNLRGAAAPYALGYVPGAWMKSIQVSKGTASVRNGYEAMTGQINVEYLQPDADDGVGMNLYGNTMSRLEANVDGSIHLGKDLSTELLGHFENSWGTHDANHDGFRDKPNVRQYNLQNRWLYHGARYIFHGGLAALTEQRDGGQTMRHARTMPEGTPLYKTDISTDRYEGYMKHAFIIDPAHSTNVALMASASMHLMDAAFGHRLYDVNQKNVYSQLLFETKFTPSHELALGASFNHDYYGQGYRLLQAADARRTRDSERENTAGAYAQYTYSIGSRLTAMAGVRIDHSNLYGTFATPRLHLKWRTGSLLTLRASAGKGYRSPHPLAENNYLLGSGRDIVIEKPRQEEAWNYGASAALNIPVFGKTLTLNAEYFYTHFLDQYIIDYDATPGVLRLANLHGKSYSHVVQVDASIEPLRGLSLTAAWRRQVAKTTYGDGRLREKPLQSRYKGLLSASYKTRMELWQFDATLQLNGSGRMPTPYTPEGASTPLWRSRFGSFAQLGAQITRQFPHFSLYLGGENLTGYRQRHPVVGYDDPWGKNFDSTLVWGPTEGAMVYAGIRLKLWRL